MSIAAPPRTLTVRPLTGALGAEIHGVDLGNLDDATKRCRPRFALADEILLDEVGAKDLVHRRPAREPSTHLFGGDCVLVPKDDVGGAGVQQ